MVMNGKKKILICNQFKDHSKMKIILLFIVSITATFTFSQTGNEPVSLKFNRVNYFAPGSQYSKTISEIDKAYSYITIDFELNSIKILTYYSNPPSESIYVIKSVDNSISNLYKFVCRASNYAEVLIEVDLTDHTVMRKVIHNGIIHKYYNE